MKFILFLAALFITLAVYLVATGQSHSAEKYISPAKVRQIVKQEKERCPRCNEKELLDRINKRIARGW